MGRGARQATVHSVAQSQTQLKQLSMPASLYTSTGLQDAFVDFFFFKLIMDKFFLVSGIYAHTYYLCILRNCTCHL